MNRIGLLLPAVLLTACAGLFGWGNTRQGVSSSLVDYLYPQGEIPPKQEGQIPHLQLPLTVGLAFVPDRSGSSGALPEAQRMKLLNDVKMAFQGRDFIREIIVIPDAYMRGGRGFGALEQTARLYDIDVMTLVSYDQVTHTAERAGSFLYWTIIGAYVVEGNRNDVQTFVDTAVFDVPTRKLLFRAPGVSKAESSSTLVNVERDIRGLQEKDFGLAMADMTVNLDRELGVFKERIRTEGTVRVTHAGSTGDGGGGSADSAWLALLAALLAVRRARRKA
ncbi:MAG: rhombotarget lipoprotein [Steroidobacteraceae bacterium]